MSRKIPIVGVVGSIGSGKSSLSAAIAERLSGLHLNADILGHELLSEDAVRAQLRDLFGDVVLNEAGAIDRRALAALVFGDGPEHAAQRRQLETLLHPLIREQIAERLQQAERSDRPAVVILDAAVMLEAGWHDACDALLCVDAPRAERLQRVASRGWDESELSRRERNQWSLANKQAAADLFVENSGPLENAVDQVVDWLRQRFPILERKAIEMA